MKWRDECDVIDTALITSEGARSISPAYELRVTAMTSAIYVTGSSPQYQLGQI